MGAKASKQKKAIELGLGLELELGSVVKKSEKVIRANCEGLVEWEVKCAFQHLENHQQFGVIDLLKGLSGPIPTVKADLEKLKNIDIDPQFFANLIVVSSVFIQKHNLRRDSEKWVAILGPLVGQCCFDYP